MSPWLELQTALRSALATALDPVPIYDNVPQNSAPVYVQIGLGNGVHDGWKAGAGVRHMVQIDVYSTYRGLKEIKDYLGRIYSALNYVTLSMPNYRASRCVFVFSDAFFEPDGARGVIRFSIITDPAI